MKLHIAKNLILPIEAVTRTFGILAIRGAGKTYTASVMAEEMLKAGQPICVIDPIGVWWGLKSSADGKKAGYEIIVLGGDHADLPLEETAGETVADFIINERASVVLDLSHFRKAARTRFLTAFMEKMYHSNRLPLHIFLDEADEYAPQRPQPGQQRLLGALEDIVRRGRARGIGCTLITQRSAVVNKDVLTQVEALFVLRTIHNLDLKAIDEWIKYHGTPKEREKLMTSVGSLKNGTAWFWSPGWLNIFEQVHIRKRNTFDSSKTPEIGAKTIMKPRRMADVDLDALRTKMASTIEKAKANDPTELRRRIARLESDKAKLEREQAKPAPAPTVAPGRPKKAISEALIKRVQTTSAGLEKTSLRVLDACKVLSEALDHAMGTKIVDISRELPPPLSSARIQVRPPVVGQNGDTLNPARQRILDSLVWLETIGVGQADRAQLALLSDHSPSSGYYANNISSLKTLGYIIYPGSGAVQITIAGKARANPPDQPRTSEDIQESILRKLNPARQRILKSLIEHWPKDRTREETAEASGHALSSGYYANNISSLKTLGVITYPSSGILRAADILFIQIGIEQ